MSFPVPLIVDVAVGTEQFRSPPVGPIGAYVQLKEECKGYAVCIEGHLRNSLSNFVVSCQE